MRAHRTQSVLRATRFMLAWCWFLTPPA